MGPAELAKQVVGPSVVYIWSLESSRSSQEVLGGSKEVSTSLIEARTYHVLTSTRGRLRAVPEIILEGVGRRHFFVLWGGGCFVDNVSERSGVESNLSWESRRI